MGWLQATGGHYTFYKYMDELVRVGHTVYLAMPNQQPIRWQMGLNKELLEGKYKISKCNGVVIPETEFLIAHDYSMAMTAYQFMDRTIPCYIAQQYEELFRLDGGYRVNARLPYFIPSINIIAGASWLKDFIERRFNRKCYFVAGGMSNIDCRHIPIDPKEKFLNPDKYNVLIYTRDDHPLYGLGDSYDVIDMVGDKVNWLGWGYPTKEPHPLIQFVGGRGVEDQIHNLFIKSHISFASHWFWGADCGTPERMSACMANISYSGFSSDTITNGLDGVLVSPRDVKAIAENITYMCEHRDETMRMAVLGRERAEYFTWDKCTERLITTLKQIKQDWRNNFSDIAEVAMGKVGGLFV